MRRFCNYRVRRPILVAAICLALCGGVLASRVEPFVAAWVWWACLAGGLWTVRRHAIITVICLAGAAFGLGWWRGDAAMVHEQAWRRLSMQQVVVEGVATDEAIYGKHSQLEVVLTAVRIVEPESRRIVGNVTVRGFGAAMVYRGDTVQVSGKLYPSLGNSRASISYGKVLVLARDDSWVNNLRRDFAAGMQSALPEPVASFALGLLIGQRTTLPDDVSDQLRHVGLTHVIAVSGYNLTVIVMACRRLLAGRSKYQATAACFALLGIFLLITGTAPPVVRASIISLLSILAWYYGRTIKPMVLLLAGAAMTVLVNPFYLWGNVSWYLSFLAFYGVLVLAPLVMRRMWGAREPTFLMGLMIESACATIVVLPYVLFIFGQMSVVSLLANILVVPGIPMAMVFGLLGGLAGMWIPALAGWFAWPARWLLTYMLDIANLLSRVPFAFIDDIRFPLGAMIVSYALIVGVTVVLWHKTKHIARQQRLASDIPPSQ